MIDIIYEDIPYGCLPVYYTDETAEFYTVSGITNAIEIVKMNTVGLKRIVLPLFEQQYEKSYSYKGVDWKALSKICDDSYQIIRSIKQVPQTVIQLFSNCGCQELRAVTMGESRNPCFDGKSMKYIWSRQAGYLGIKTLGDVQI